MRMIGKLRKNESGAIAVIVAFLITALIGLTAIVVDVGYLYEVRRQLQSAADAAALAGAQELIKDATDPEILAVADEYAKKNDFDIDEGTSEELWMHMGSPGTEITDTYVKVTVEKKANLFFARIFGLVDQNIQAQAKAQVVYLTGLGKGAVPWGLVVIKTSTVTAKVEGMTYEVSLAGEEAGEEFSGTVDGITLPARQSGYPVTITTYNGQGFPEVVYPAAYITVLNETDPIKSISLNKHMLWAGQSATLNVETTSDVPPAIRFDNKNVSMNYKSGPDSENIYSYSLLLNAPSITYAVEYFPVDISVGSGVDEFEIIDAAVLAVRRSTYPIQNIAIDQTSFIADSGSGLASVSMYFNVSILDFSKFDVPYDLKIVQGGETGNFNALDFRYLWHPPEYTDNHGQHDNAYDYYESIAGVYEGAIHYFDIIETQPGNLSAPQTANALETRFGDCINHDYEYYTNPDNKHDVCGRVVFIPLVEKIERLNGKSEVKVVELAAFYIEEIPEHGLSIRGRFVKYMALGEYSEEPPGDLYLETVRLVSPDF